MQRNEHEMRLEHGRWHRDQRADAYIQLLDLAEQVGGWLLFVNQNWDSDDPLPPARETLGHQAGVWARISIYASDG